LRRCMRQLNSACADEVVQAERSAVPDQACECCHIDCDDSGTAAAAGARRSTLRLRCGLQRRLRRARRRSQRRGRRLERWCGRQLSFIAAVAGHCRRMWKHQRLIAHHAEVTQITATSGAVVAYALLRCRVVPIMAGRRHVRALRQGPGGCCVPWCRTQRRWAARRRWCLRPLAPGSTRVCATAQGAGTRALTPQRAARAGVAQASRLAWHASKESMNHSGPMWRAWRAGLLTQAPAGPPAAPRCATAARPALTAAPRE
jgi:hypothetical protein